MKSLLGLLALALAAGCGQADDGPRLSFDLFVSRAIADQVSGFQVAMLASGQSFNCIELQKSCLAGQVQSSSLVQLTDASGKQRSALLFPIALKPGTQDVVARGIPVGSDYAVVVEALSKDDPPKLVGSACNYVRKIESGTNPTVFASIAAITPAPLSCDPRFAK